MSFLHALEQAGLMTFVVVVALYFAPSIVAKARQKTNAGAIFALNLTLGWTLLGWAGALVWACMSERPAEPATTVVPKREVY